MKLVLISDLHLGKNVPRSQNDPFYNKEILQKMQRSALEELREKIVSMNPDVVVVAGDVFDRSTPPISSVIDAINFFSRLSEEAEVVLISGNHDYGNSESFFDVFLSEPMKHMHVFTARDVVKILKEKKVLEIGGKRFFPMPYPAFFSAKSIEQINKHLDAALKTIEYDYFVGHLFTTDVIKDVKKYEDFDYDLSKEPKISPRAIKGFGLLGHYHVFRIEENYAYPSSLVPPIVISPKNFSIYPEKQKFVVLDPRPRGEEFEGIKLITVYINKRKDVNSAIERLYEILQKVKYPFVRIGVYYEYLPDLKRGLEELKRLEFVCRVKVMMRKTIDLSDVVESTTSVDEAIKEVLKRYLRGIDRQFGPKLLEIYRKYEDEKPEEIAKKMFEYIESVLGEAE